MSSFASLSVHHDTRRFRRESGIHRSIQPFQERLHRLIEQAQAIELRAFETQAAEAFAPALVDRLGKLLAAGLEVLADVFDEHQDATPLPQATVSDGFLYAIDRLMETANSRQRIADLCFVARLELRAKQQRMAALARSEDAWHVLSDCASARRKLIKSARAVEQALCELEGVRSESTSAHETELQISIEVRRAYMLFRAEILRDGPPEPCETVQRLRQAGVSIAKLVGRDVYENLRIDDRLQLRGLQTRLLAWLRAGHDGQPRTGLRLWQDLAAFAGMLVTVNNRAVLREHDQELASQVERELAASPDPHARVPHDLLRRLEPMRGRDEALDLLLAQERAPDVEACRAVLRRVHQQLGAPSSGAIGDFETPEADASFASSHPPRPAEAGDTEIT